MTDLPSLIADQWQPIKTAPKDGTKVLLGCPPSRGYPGVVEKCFWWAQGKKWWDWVSPDKPSHWMPLPSPPRAKEDGTNG